MTESTATPPPGPPPADPPAEPPPPAPRPLSRRPLTRARDDRVFAGVCGGLGRHLGVDPVLLRVLLPVLAVFGGSGIVLYALGWLLIPDEGATESEAQQLARGRGSGKALLAVIVVAVGVLALAGLHDPGPPGALLLVALVVALVLYARRGGPGETRAESLAGSPPVDTGYRDVGDQDVGYPLPPPAAPQPRERSPLGLATVSVALLASGLLLVADRLGVVTVGAWTVLATALAVVGAGLVVGAWVGRARWLIAVGVLLAVALLAVDATPRGPLGRGVGDRSYAPVALTDVRPAYRLGIGNHTVDLSAVRFARTGREVAASVGVGELAVLVPRDVDVTVRGRVGLGELVLFDTRAGGNGLDRTVTVPAQGTSQGSIELDAEVGVGKLEVRRATA